MSVITLDEAKNYLKVDSADDNALIGSMIEAAEAAIELWTRRTLLTQAFELIYDDVSDSIEIVKSPLQAVVKIEVVDDAGVKTEVDPDLYVVDIAGQRGRVKLKDGCTWPDHRGFASFIITATAGYGATAEAIPAPIKQAILETLAEFYANRESGEIPAGAKALLQPCRIIRL